MKKHRTTPKSKSRLSAPLKDEHGLAMIETLPILFIFVVLLGFGLGMFGFVHTAILNSIGSRTYAIETMQNRADVALFRDRKGDDPHAHYAGYGTRMHIIDSEKNMQAVVGPQYATDRNIAFGLKLQTAEANIYDHNRKIYDIKDRNRKGGVEASPAWVMVGYGMCINAGCGD